MGLSRTQAQDETRSRSWEARKRNRETAGIRRDDESGWWARRSSRKGRGQAGNEEGFLVVTGTLRIKVEIAAINERDSRQR